MCFCGWWGEPQSALLRAERLLPVWICTDFPAGIPMCQGAKVQTDWRLGGRNISACATFCFTSTAHRVQTKRRAIGSKQNLKNQAVGPHATGFSRCYKFHLFIFKKGHWWPHLVKLLLIFARTCFPDSDSSQSVFFSSPAHCPSTLRHPQVACMLSSK